MTLRGSFLATWISGVVAFAIVLIMHLPLVLTEVPGGILDHQAAATGAEVTRIQEAWIDAGLKNTAARAMMGDLMFITIYGLGTILGGLYFRSVGNGVLRHLAILILISGAVFIVTDFAETITQFMQLMANIGTDEQAQLASTLRPIKMVAWIVTFAGILAAFAIRRKQKNTG
ncbi:hypothetical protein GCM10023115_15310 [Pontixanthobacter gangjinensis]|uniref:Uncharacterized protein n=1 Tax=Pontixanthobacter gangjinensis TaxID=1028742 RepID=A0A6I4SM78_9SPHN|nr:hypothetical protein [Pontixanthobacter gangjinensis]MXO56774.1 hypothetical protein [Pontixanthobacter gangjinensis]